LGEQETPGRGDKEPQHHGVIFMSKVGTAYRRRAATVAVSAPRLQLPQSLFLA